MIARRPLRSTTPSVGSIGELTCGYCASSYLHQEQVIVVAREKQDEPSGTVVTVWNGDHLRPRPVDTVKVRPATGEDHDGRRQHLRIRFVCEDCRQTSELVIRQHKGLTCIGWRDPEPAAEDEPVLTDETMIAIAESNFLRDSRWKLANELDFEGEQENDADKTRRAAELEADLADACKAERLRSVLAISACWLYVRAGDEEQATRTARAMLAVGRLTPDGAAELQRRFIERDRTGCKPGWRTRWA